ncbi:MAG: hypothetical protein A0129_06720 [Limnobacter sp. CACIAM 66H1]|uniref:hypothetical protein n=1 Tax=Limnobacter sp. CACIAM 66H1 TaxID=1813033 RepID=UPI0007A89F66|nr:hypothetical protein [Limnobacter sp. CACIAM 66H1]KYP11542.1 MAG: hypothetical protein A0129_06720 [Limnobacter sp. CACIAM 66H1]
MTFSSASAFAIVSAGVFLLVGLFSGLWKFLQMWRSEQGLAHPYLDIAHRASLLYGFACLTLAILAHFSTFSPNYNLFAAVTVIVFFALAVTGYLIQAALNGPDNQLRQPHKLGNHPMPRAGLALFMVALILAEIGGTLYLFAGALQNPLLQFWS